MRRADCGQFWPIMAQMCFGFSERIFFSIERCQWGQTPVLVTISGTYLCLVGSIKSHLNHSSICLVCYWFKFCPDIFQWRDLDAPLYSTCHGDQASFWKVGANVNVMISPYYEHHFPFDLIYRLASTYKYAVRDFDPNIGYPPIDGIVSEGAWHTLKELSWYFQVPVSQ